MDSLRIDKWLWAARFYKTRSLAAEEIGKNRVRINGQVAKASREVKVGDCVQLLQAQVLREVLVKGISAQRGPAPVAQQLYEETPQSMARRESAAELRKLMPEPAQAIEQGRPTKRDRRQMDKAWNDRWSAGLD